jgi:predicted kinase
VRLVLVGGPPGVGKSTLAEALADQSGWSLLQSDVVRKELAGLGPTESAEAPFEAGIYRPEVTETVYAELLDRAGRLLRNGESVVLDASWRAPAHRRMAADLAAEVVADAVPIRCEAPEAVASERIARRLREGGQASDATPLLARRLRADESRWGIELDTSGRLEEALDRAVTLTT